MNAATGLFKETLQANGGYVQSPISIGSLSPTNTKIEWSDLYGNLDLATLTDQIYYNTFYSDVSSISFSQPPTLVFASTAYEATSSDSPQIITITNSGNQPLKFSAITFPADFSEGTAAANACAAGVSLAQGANCILAVEFTPKTPGTTGSSINLSESVLITTNALNKTTMQTIQVSGTETFPAASQVTLKLSSASVVYGGNTTASVSLSAGVATPTKAPTGTVKLVLDGSTVLETLTLSGSGHGTAAAYGTISGVNAGGHTITAVYSGDATNPASTSAPAAYTVTPAPVTLSAYCPSTVVFGSFITCQVYTAPVMAGSPGVLTYQVSGNGPESVALSGGSSAVSFQPETLSGVNDTIVFSYAAQGNYAAATPVIKTVAVTSPR